MEYKVKHDSFPQGSSSGHAGSAAHVVLKNNVQIIVCSLASARFSSRRPRLNGEIAARRTLRVRRITLPSTNLTHDETTKASQAYDMTKFSLLAPTPIRVKKGDMYK
eukprot:6193440-Pleurochrysis_carterae.AAC.1